MANILLIEPDRILSRLYADALRANGHEVASCRSAQGAIQLADERLPDLILLELQLPRHNGVEFLYELRSYTEWQRIPVVLLSSVPPTEVLSPVLWDQLGVAAYYYKPRATLASLVQAVNNVLPLPVT